MCLDTAHIWSSGYDINEYYSLICKSNEKDILVVHFNNSKKDQGSHVDTHDNIFDGKIKLKDMETFMKNIKGDPIIILEKPSDDLKKDIKWIRKI
jgi:deoxyribonuclease-4